MAKFWIEATDESGDNWAARWQNITDKQADNITRYIESIIGRPDTIA